MGGFLFLMAVDGQIAGPSARRSSSQSSPTPSYSTSRGEVGRDAQPGDQMAAIEEQTTSPSELSRARFRTLLERLAPRCGESERRVSDMIVTAQQMLKEKGIAVRLVEIAEELDHSVPLAGNGKCAELLALYSILRQSHGVTDR